MKHTALALVVILASFVSACSKDSSPTSATPTPTPTPTVTKIISLGGAMAFGDIQVGSSFTATLNVSNSGNTVLTVTGLTGSNGITSVTTASPTSFTVAPGGSQNVTVKFSPTAAVAYSGTITVTADQTSGTNTIAFSGNGSLVGLPVFAMTGVGDSVFTLPVYVTKLRVTGSTASTCQNFIVKANGSSFINVILGTCSVADERTHDGTYVIAGGATISLTSSSGVNWAMTEVR